MKNPVALAFALVLLLPTLGWSDTPTLRFVKPLGVPWKDGRFGWMGFVAFSPDGARVASDGPATADDVSGALTIWSFPEGRFIKKLPLRPEAISADWAYAAGFHGVVDVTTGKVLISRPETEFATYAFSPDSRYVAESAPRAGGHGNHVRILELPAKKQVAAFGRYATDGMAFSPDGKLLATGHWNLVKLWNPATGERAGVIRGFGRYVRALAFSPDGKFLAAGTDFGAIQLWDVARREKLWSLTVGGQVVSTPAFSPDGALLAIGVYGTGTVWLIDTSTGKVVDHQAVSDIGCGAVAFSPDGRFLITPSTGGLIKWPYDRGGTIRVFRVLPRLGAGELKIFDDLPGPRAVRSLRGADPVPPIEGAAWPMQGGGTRSRD
jgi:WD40 repeat protein